MPRKERDSVARSSTALAEAREKVVSCTHNHRRVSPCAKIELHILKSKADDNLFFAIQLKRLQQTTTNSRGVIQPNGTFSECLALGNTAHNYERAYGGGRTNAGRGRDGEGKGRSRNRNKESAPPSNWRERERAQRRMHEQRGNAPVG